MTTVTQGNASAATIGANRILEVSTTGEAYIDLGVERHRVLSSDATFRMRSSDNPRRATVRAITGTANYTIYYSDVVPFTSNLTLTIDHDGKLLRCDDSSNVTITVPASLPEGFSVGFAMWDAGTVTISAGSGATNRSSVSALGTQYQWGSLLVMKNANDAAAEFVLGGQFA